jgi:hypothetical protein
MARIQNLDDLGQRFISLTRGDIPEGLRKGFPTGHTRWAWNTSIILVQALSTPGI